MDRTLAIVGCGPRGLSALESLFLNLAAHPAHGRIKVVLFEETNQFGSGPVYDSRQTPSNWINVSQRVLTLAERPEIKLGTVILPAFPSYHAWSKVDPSAWSEARADVYPPRAAVGRYLQERFTSIAAPLVQANIATRVSDRVDDVALADAHVVLTTRTGAQYTVDEVLLTIGHQPTERDAQLKTWHAFAQENDRVRLFTDPYPIRQFFTGPGMAGAVVGLRGFGLAMMDVVRGIVEGLDGTFVKGHDRSQSLTFIAGARAPKCFVPFSLDGLPMSPKPLNAKIDAWFEPEAAQRRLFEQKIGSEKVQANASGPEFLIEAIAPIAGAIYSRLNPDQARPFSTEALTELTRKWLADSTFEHPLIVSKKVPPEEVMSKYVAMATGSAAVSLDYCIGQVWRHCQPSIYKCLSFSACTEAVIASIIELDERMKRYAYGPPVESIQQLLALVSAEVMTLAVVDDPDIELTPAGWKLTQGEASVTADVMINSVVDAPAVRAVQSPLMRNMLQNELIQPVHDDLGVATDEHGYVVSTDQHKQLPIALLGRLAKGTIIGVDALLECFGRRPELWAEKAAARHAAWASKNG